MMECESTVPNAGSFHSSKPVADVGLLGYPNAGKSTLLRAVTAAQPKVADYPFTTVIPNLGVCAPRAFGGDGPPMKWLGIPGLLEGASAGRGPRRRRPHGPGRPNDQRPRE